MREYILLTPAFGLVIFERGPLYFSGTFNLAAFITSPRQDYSNAAVRLCQILYVTIPTFKNWREFIKPKAKFAFKIDKILSEAFQDLSPAESAPNDYILKTLRANLSLDEHPSDDEEEEEEEEEEERSLWNAPTSFPVSVTSPFLDFQRFLDEMTERLKSISSDQAIDFGRSLVVLQNIIHHFMEQDGIRRVKQFHLGDSESSSITVLSPENIKELISLQVQVHRKLQTKKKTRFASRKALIEIKSQSKGNDMFQRAAEDYALQEKVVNIIFSIYDQVASARDLGNFYSELCELDRLLSDVIDINISIVVAGLISVGKSTVVNCLVGQSIAPKREETMTAIPIRYVHQPDQEEPFMFVPFSHQLNETVEKIRLYIEEVGLAAVREGLRTNHLRDLAELIHNKLKFEPEYRGANKVLEASFHIHDLYRLAVDPFFPEEKQIAENLPFSWCKGLDSYLTVTCCFPQMVGNSSLATLSLVDTPGIDEEGVQKLRFHEVLADALTVCNFGIMITTHDKYSATSMEPLRHMFYHSRTLDKSPTIALVTHGDKIKSKEKENFLQNVTSSLVHRDEDGNPFPLFDRKEVYLISATKMLLGFEMKRFLETKCRKPLEDDENPEVARLANDWINSGAQGDDIDEKKEEYESSNIEKLKKRSDRLMVTSEAGEPFSHLIKSTLENAVRHSISTTIPKVIRVLQSLTRTLKLDTETLSKEEIKEAERQTHLVFRQLEHEKKIFRKNMTDKRKSILKRLSENISTVVQEMRVMIAKGLRLDTVSLSTFSGRLALHTRHIRDENTKLLLTQSQKVSFGSPFDITEAHTDLCHAVKLAAVDFLMYCFQKVPTELAEWAREEKRKLHTRVQDIAKHLDKNFNSSKLIGDQIQNELHNFEEAKVPDIRFGYQKRIKPAVTDDAKRNQEIVQKMGGNRGQKGEGILVNPTTAREELKNQLELILKELREELEPRLEGALETTVESLKRNSNIIFKKLLDLTNRKKEETEEMHRKLQGPREELLGQLLEYQQQLEALME